MVSLWYLYGIYMVSLWYLHWMESGGRALSRQIFNEGKNMENQEEKLFFPQIFGEIRYFVYFCTQILVQTYINP